MALQDARSRIMGFARPAGLAITLSLGALSGGCAQMGVADLPSMLASAPEAPRQTGEVNQMASREELQKATTYWGKKFQEHPRNLESALNYAMNLKAMGRKRQAMAVLQRASIFHGDSRRLASEYGRLALDLGQVKVAKRLLAMADDPAQPDWRVLSGLGTVLAKEGQYAKAIPYFQRALQHSEGRPSVLNNLALAHAMNGDAQTAEMLLRQAVENGHSTKKVRQNLALVLGLQGKYDEAKQISSHDVPDSQAASDTQAIRQMVRAAPKSSVSPNATQMAGHASPAMRPSAYDPLGSTAAWSSEVATSAPTR